MKIFLSCTSDLEVHFRRDTLTLHVTHEFVHSTVNFVFNHFCWQFNDFSVFNSQIKCSTFNSVIICDFFSCFKFFTVFSFQLIKSFNFIVKIFSQLIIQSRNFFSFNFVNFSNKYSSFTCKISSLIVFWESYFNFYFITSFCSNQLVFESWDKLT